MVDLFRNRHVHFISLMTAIERFLSFCVVQIISLLRW